MRMSRARGLMLLALLSLGLLCWAPPVDAVSPATETTPLRQSAAPGAFDALSVEQRQAIANNVLRARGIDAQPYRLDAGTSSSGYAQKVSEAVWEAEARVTKHDYGGSNVSSQQLRTRLKAKALPLLKAAGERVTTRAIPGLGAFMFGWEIGTGINRLFIDVDADPVGPSSAPDYVEFNMASEPRWATTGGWNTSPFADQPSAPPDALTASFHRWGGYHVAANLQTNDPCQDLRPNPTRFRVAEGFAYGRCSPAVAAKAFYWMPEDLVVSSRPATVEPPHWPSYGANCYWAGEKKCTPMPGMPPIEDVLSALREAFDSADGDLQRELWDWVFDELPPPIDPVWDDPQYQPPALDPTQDGAPLGRVKVPDGIGTHQDAYEAVLNANDLHLGYVETRYGVNRDHDAGDVLFVEPGQQTWVPRGSSVRVVVNPTTIPVPDVHPGETAEAYAERAYQVGWNPTEALSETPDAEEGEIVPPKTTPAQGEEGEPKQELVVWSGRRVERRMHRRGCEAPGLFSLPDPAAALADEREEKTIVEQFPSAHEPGGEVLLRRGRTHLQHAIDRDTSEHFNNYAGYGRRHIQAKHGWGAAERALTASALANPTSTTPGNRPSYRNYELDFSRSSNGCTWLVVVDRTTQGNPQPGEEGQVGIITAFGKPR